MNRTSEYSVELVGELFGDRFELQEELGRSAIADTFRARDAKTGADVAVKVFGRSGRTHRYENFLAFQRQAKALGSL